MADNPNFDSSNKTSVLDFDEPPKANFSKKKKDNPINISHKELLKLVKKYDGN